MKQLERTYVTAKQFQHKQLQKGAKFMHKIHRIAILIKTFHACAMTHWHLQWRTTQNCLRVEPIWSDSENKFTPLFMRATLKSKYYRRDNVIQKEVKPKMPAAAYSYRCYTACIIGFQFVTRSSTRYRILYRCSAL